MTTSRTIRGLLLAVAVALPLVGAVSAAGAPARDQSAHSSATDLCARNQTAPVTAAGANYLIQNNNYAGQAECIQNTNSAANFRITASGARSAVTQGPQAYPEIFAGCHWGSCSSDSGLPLRASAVGHPITSWSTKQKASGVWDAAYDIWFNRSATTTGQPNGTELMIWLGDQGAPRFPPNMPVVTIDGSKYYVRRTIRAHAGVIWRLLIYKRVVHTNAVRNLDLHGFVENALDREAIQPSWYLISIEAGFEIWHGGVGLGTTSFSIAP